MRRAVERYLEDPLAEELLRGNMKAGDLVHVTVENGKLAFHVRRTARQRAGERELEIARFILRVFITVVIPSECEGPHEPLCAS